MKLLALLIVWVTLVLVISKTVSSKEIKPASPEVLDYRHAEPLRGSSAGDTVARACGDCHSNQTSWPWYSHVPPISNWMQGHVREGRKELNFSEWASYSPRRRHDELESICGVVSTGRMPPWSYRIMHAQARLASQDTKTLCAWADAEVEHEQSRALLGGVNTRMHARK